MKTTLCLLALVAVSASVGISQSPLPPPSDPPSAAPSQTDLRKNISGLSLNQIESMVMYQTTLADRVLGILPQIRRADNPLQLFNPFAPARYGSGYDNVVFDPRTGRGEGIALFTIKF